MKAERGFLRSRVAQHIFVVFVCSALLPITALSFVAYHFVSQQLDAEARRQQRLAAKSLGMGLYEQLETREAELQLLLPLVDQATLPEKIAAAWSERLATDFAGLAAYDADGSLESIFGASIDLPRQWPPAGNSGRTALIVDHDISNEVRVLLALPPVDGRGLVAELNVESLFRPEGGHGVAGVERFAIVDQSGELIFSSTSPSDPFVEAMMMPGNRGRRLFSWTDEQTRHHAQRWTLFLNGHFVSPAWDILVSTPRQFVFTTSMRFKLSLALVVLLCLAVVILASVISIRRSLTPLDRLKEGTEKIAAGRFDTLVRVDSDDEFGLLAEAFNRMASSLREHFAALNHTARQLRLARDEAQAASRAKSDFLAMMSHEIRTPMNGIIGMAELAMESDQPEEKSACLEVVKASADSLLTVLNDVLDFAKIEAGKLELARRCFGLREVLDETTRLLSVGAASKNIALRVRADEDVPDDLVGDPVRLKQTLLNLLGNGLKFTERGEVALDVAVEEMKGEDLRLRFSIRDTGVGIATEKLETIFDPFVQAENYLTRRRGGTGLGLATCRRLVDLMEGRLWVESRLGEGSVFHFTACFGHCVQGPENGNASTAPRRAVKGGGGPEREQAESCQAPPLRILVAEDNPVNQKVVSRILEKEHHIVEVAANGQLAVDKAISEDFDLILMDIQMPVMDGMEATRTLRDRGLKIPIIALTAHALERDQRQCLEAGMDAHLAKPVRRGEVLEMVARMARHADRAGRQSVGEADPVHS